MNGAERKGTAASLRYWEGTRYLQVFISWEYDHNYAFTWALYESVAMTELWAALFIAVLKALCQVCEEKDTMLSVTWILSLFSDPGNRISSKWVSYTHFVRKVTVVMPSLPWMVRAFDVTFQHIYPWLTRVPAYIRTWHIYVQFPKL